MVNCLINFDTERKILRVMSIKENVMRYGVSVLFAVIFALVAIFAFTRPNMGQLPLAQKDASCDSVQDAGSGASRKPPKSLSSKPAPVTPDASLKLLKPDGGVKSKSLKPDAGVKSKSLKPDASAKLLVSDAGVRSKD
jgi:hypothetical protein